MYCKNCGANVRDDVEFCTECGYFLNTVVKPAAPSHGSAPAAAPKSVHTASVSSSVKVICPDCEGKNDMSRLNCIHCGKVIRKEALDRSCPICGSVMSRKISICPVCKFNISSGRWSSAEAYNEWVAIHGGTPIASTAPADKFYERITPKINGRAVKLLIFVAVVVIAVVVVSNKKAADNEKAQDLYDRAYDALYDTDYIEVDSRIQRLVDRAVEQSDSFFVSAELTNDILELQKECQDYATLCELEEMIADGATSGAYFMRSNLDTITSSRVIDEYRYEYVSSFIERAEFKENNKTWAENKLHSLQSDHAETIDSWSRNHSVEYYTGYVTLYNSSSDGITLSLEDYYGDSHIIDINYNFKTDSTWDSSLDELKALLENDTPCVMAAITAYEYGSENVFSYSYTAD